MNHSVSTLEIKLLADCQEFIPDIASLWYEHLGRHWDAGFTIENTKLRFLTHCNHDCLPLAWVAVMDGKPIGMTALRKNEIGPTGDYKPELTPWLGSLVIDPSYRKLGVGKQLIETAKTQAKKFNYQKLYLLTSNISLTNWYARLGWQQVDTDTIYSHPIIIMSINLV